MLSSIILLRTQKIFRSGILNSISSWNSFLVLTGSFCTAFTQFCFMQVGCLFSVCHGQLLSYICSSVYLNPFFWSSVLTIGVLLLLLFFWQIWYFVFLLYTYSRNWLGLRVWPWRRVTIPLHLFGTVLVYHCCLSYPFRCQKCHFCYG